MRFAFCTFFFALFFAPLSSSQADNVVVADGVATEVIFALGAQDRIVGVDETSRHPAAATLLPQIGYFRRLSAEGVLSLAPSMLLAAPSAGPPVALDQIKSAGVRIVTLPEVSTLDDIAPKITAVGNALGMRAKAQDLATSITTEISALRAAASKSNVKPRVIFVLAIRDSAPLVAGTNTTSHEIIKESGAVNVVSFEGFKPMSREAVIAAAPDLLLMTDEHSKKLGGIEKVLARPEFALTPAGRKNRSMTLPALTVLGLGPRSPESVLQLREALRD